MLYLHFTRKNDWLRYRVPTCLGFFYLGTLGGALSIAESLQRLLLLLVIFAGSGSFVRYYNDLFDIEADRLGNKFNLAAADPPHLRVLRPVLSTALVFLPFFFLPKAGMALVLMLVQHGLYIAYSTPPLRLKTRGAAGLVTDALYGQTIPPLAALAIAVPGVPEWRWLGVLLISGLLLFTSGLNNILFHQLEDRRRDRRAGLKTFTAGAGPQYVKKLALQTLLPLELGLLLTTCLAWSGVVEPLAPGITAVAAAFLAWPVFFRSGSWKRRPLETILTLNPVYETVVPLAALLALSLHHPLYWLLAAGHVLLFPDTTLIRLQPMLLWAGMRVRARYWRTERGVKDFYYHWLLVRYIEIKTAFIEAMAWLRIKPK